MAPGFSGGLPPSIPYQIVPSSARVSCHAWSPVPSRVLTRYWGAVRRVAATSRYRPRYAAVIASRLWPSSLLMITRAS